jgi:hypothetical protein
MATSQAQEKESRNLILNPSRIQLAEYQRNDWVGTAEQGTTIDDLLQPGYWSHKAQDMKPYDRVEMRIDDGIWMVELLVLEVGRNWAKVKLLHEHRLTIADIAQTQIAKLHKVEWKGPHLKHVVIRLSDDEIVKDGISSKVDAEQWIADHEKVM